MSALLIDPFFANEGFPDLPEGWLTPAVEEVRKAGGIVIADEVQPGFGRLGTHFWGHQKAGFLPDVVTIGKPMANGHPVAATITRPEIMAAFRSAFGYFNTFGGNPVSAAAAMATLDVLENEDLISNAAATGAHALDLLHGLDHPLIAETRGHGLFFAVELVHPVDRRPATAFAEEVVERMRMRGVLLNRIGRHMEE